MLLIIMGTFGGDRFVHGRNSFHGEHEVLAVVGCALGRGFGFDWASYPVLDVTGQT